MPETTAQYHHVPVRSKEGYDTIRTIDLGDGIKALAGKKGDGPMMVLTVLYPTSKGDMEKAKAWCKSHDLESPVNESAIAMEEALDDKVSAIRDAWYAKNMRPAETEAKEVSDGPGYVKNIFETYVIVEQGGKLFKVPYKQGDDGVEFGEPVEVKVDYVKAELIPDYISRISLSDDGVPETWIEIHREGEWKHNNYGTLSMTKDKIESIVKNFVDNVVGHDLSGDTHHKPGPAQFWFKELVHKGKKLMARVQWTDVGADNVKQRRYLYISPEYHEDWTDQSGVKHGPTLLGAALTNRPFLPGQAPLAMSEDLELELTEGRVALSVKEPNRKKERKMDEQEIRQEEGRQEEVVSLEAYTALEAKVKALEENTKALEAKSRADAERSLRLESEAKGSEIGMAMKSALDRGVDAFTVNFLRPVLMALPRDGGDTIKLEDAGEMNLYHAILRLLEGIPAKVPTGEVSMEADNRPVENEEEVRKAVERVLNAR